LGSDWRLNGRRRGLGGGKYKEQELIAHSGRVVHKVVGFISLSKTWASSK